MTYKTNQSAPTRRRFLAISGATTLFSISNLPAQAKPNPARQIWRGTAMGADTSIELHGLTPEGADALITKCITELDRLEALFSLHDNSSQISVLNQTGTLNDPDPDFIALLSLSQTISTQTSGAFDISVQPLWELYSNHYKEARLAGIKAPGEPSPDMLSKTLASMGMDKLHVSAGKVRLAAGKITLNGIAQGYISDRLTALLKANGVKHALVNAGEYAAIGPRPDGSSWPISILDPQNGGSILKRLELADHALSTSGAYGTPFSDDGSVHHMFDPRTGRSSNRYLSVSVQHPKAAIADALSTAFYAMDKQDISTVSKQMGALKTHVLMPDGTSLVV